MDTTRDRRWLLSVVAALVVGAVVVAGWWFTQPRAGEGDTAAGSGDTAGVASGSAAGGGTSGDPGPAGPAGGNDKPAVGRDPVLVEQGVRTDGYAVRGHRLVLRYTTGVPECYGEVEVAQVAEEDDAVTVRLVTVPPEKSAEVCIDLALTGTVAVRLAAPLGERQVLDGAFEPAVGVRRVTDGQGVPGPGAGS